MTTPFEKAGFKPDDVFRVVGDGHHTLKNGDLVTLNKDDGTDCPCFWNESKTDYFFIFLSRLELVSSRHADEEPLTGTGIDGWISWVGGNRPVDREAMVDVKFRDQTQGNSMAADYYWPHCNSPSDIIAYRLYQPENEVSELNECIAPLVMDGQPHTVSVPGDIPAELAEPTESQILELLRDISHFTPKVNIDQGLELAQYLLDVGYRKQA